MVQGVAGSHAWGVGTEGVTVEVDPAGGSAVLGMSGGEVSATVAAAGFGSDASALEGEVRVKAGEGQLQAGVRQVVSGTLSGTTLGKLGFASGLDSVGPFDARFHAEAGAAFVPDLRERLIPSDRDALGLPVGPGDASISAAVFAAGGRLALRPVELAPAVHVEGEASGNAVLFAPIEHDPGTGKLIAHNTNGALAFDVGTAAGLSRLQVQARLGATFDQGPLHARVDLSVHSNVMDDPTFALARGGPLDLLAGYAFTERAVDASVRWDEPHLSLDVHVPLATTEQDHVRATVAVQLRALTARASL